MAFTYCESAWLCAAIALLPAPIATVAVALIFISLIFDWVVYRMKGAADDMPAEVRRSDAGVEGLALPFGGSDVLQRVLGADHAADDDWELDVAEADFFPGEEDCAIPLGKAPQLATRGRRGKRQDLGPFVAAERPCSGVPGAVWATRGHLGARRRAGFRSRTAAAKLLRPPGSLPELPPGKSPLVAALDLGVTGLRVSVCEANEADTIDAFLRSLANFDVPDAVHNGVITETASHVHLSAAARSNEADADGLEAEPDGYITDDDLPFAAYQVGTCSGKATREASLDLQVLDMAHGRSDVAGHEAFVGAVAPAAVESSQVASMDLGVAVRGRGPAHGEAEHRSEPLRLQGPLAQRRCGSLGLAGHGDAALAAELCRRPPGRKARRRTAKLMATAAAGSPAVPSEQVGEEVTEPPGDEVDDGREQQLHEKLVHEAAVAGVQEKEMVNLLYSRMEPQHGEGGPAGAAEVQAPLGPSVFAKYGGSPQAVVGTPTVAPTAPSATAVSSAYASSGVSIADAVEVLAPLGSSVSVEYDGSSRR